MVWIELNHTDVMNLAAHYLRQGMEAARCRCQDACDCHEYVSVYGERAERFFDLLPYEEQRLFWLTVQPELERHRKVLAVEQERDRQWYADSLPTKEEQRRFQAELRRIWGRGTAKAGRT